MARILAEEGFIWKYEVDTSNGAKPEIVVTNKYEGKRPVLTDLKRVSKPGRRQYIGSGEVPTVVKGFGISIISTSRGLMSGAKARRSNVGGEILAIVW
jgi:small subunit ribosomal protein S8